MTQQNVLQILNQHLGQQSVQIIDGQVGIYRCHKDFHDKPYQVLYIDCSNSWANEDFDAKKLESYQEGILLHDYYKNSGALQWNFYYAFIAEEDRIQNNLAKKKAIESDELYARKLVISENELDQWLSKIENLSKPSETVIEQDLSSIWINKLKENRLDAVFLDETYTAGVDNYLENDPTLTQEDEEGEGNETTKQRETISFIKSLNIIQYRKQPTNTYIFGKVNLIKGINGAGKTSLLEAIELVLCGKTDRNPDYNATNVRLKVTLADDIILEHTPNNNRLFKERDKVWYNNAGQRSNRLHVSFNKYNFYNTDAAHLLSTDSNKANVRKAFEDIALGEEVNHIENRLKGFYERFYSAFTQYSKITNEFTIELEAENKLMKDIQALDKNPEKFLKELLEEATLIKWKTINEKSDKFISSIEKEITSAKFYLQSIQTLIHWEKSISYNWILKTIQELSKVDQEVSKVIVQLKDRESELWRLRNKINELRSLAAILQKLSLYYNDSRIQDLFGLTDKINATKAEISRLKKAKQIADEITVEDLTFFVTEKGLNQIDSELEEQIESQTSILKKEQDKKKKLEKGFNQLETIVSEIKTQGKQYLKIEPQATKCPLCHAEYINETLVTLIQKSWENFRSTKVLEELIIQITESEKSIKLLQEKREIAVKLRQIASLINEKNNENTSKLLKEIKDISKTISTKQTFLNGLTDSKDYFDRKELTELLYNELIDELSGLNFDVKDKISFNNAMVNIKESEADLNKQISDINNSINELTEKRGNLLKPTAIEGIDLLKDRLNSLTDARESLDEIIKIIDVNKESRISAIEKDVDKFQSLFEQYKNIKKQKDEYDTRIISSKEKIGRLGEQIEENIVYRDRAQTAYKAIEELQQNYSKASFLRGFIEKNKEEIAEIFKMIHSPKEFDSLRMEDKFL